VILEYGVNENQWNMFRTAYLSTSSELDVGRMVAAPEGDGFEATFTGFRLRHINS
jgi:regulation of enolase protein 1 (concanavalin A-like superfamily)